MRFVVLVKATAQSETGALPSREMLEKMGAFNDELLKDGIMLDGAGLHASSQGARLRFEGGSVTVMEGPFSQTSELVAGFWIVQGPSKDAIVERFKRAPFDGGQVIEIRPMLEAEDFDE
ncbi:MAG TPA: YciI family protein [Candidatus Cybelea sp.]|nr:YciI family protein [Candidatus Cybelea sp.]